MTASRRDLLPVTCSPWRKSRLSLRQSFCRPSNYLLSGALIISKLPSRGSGRCCERLLASSWCLCHRREHRQQSRQQNYEGAHAMPWISIVRSFIHASNISHGCLAAPTRLSIVIVIGAALLIALSLNATLRFFSRPSVGLHYDTMLPSRRIMHTLHSVPIQITL